MVATVYERGSDPGMDNPNIAIIGYSYFHAKKNWVQLVGYISDTDRLNGISVRGNHLLVLTTAVHKKYFSLYKLRCDSGYKTISVDFKSSGPNQALDIQNDHRGIYILALINNGLTPHPTAGYAW